MLVLAVCLSPALTEILRTFQTNPQNLGSAVCSPKSCPLVFWVTNRAIQPSGATNSIPGVQNANTANFRCYRNLNPETNPPRPIPTSFLCLVITLGLIPGAYVILNKANRIMEVNFALLFAFYLRRHRIMSIGTSPRFLAILQELSLGKS